MFHQTPEPARMILFLQVHQLMQDDVIAHRRRHLNQPIVQRDSSCSRARSPTRALIADREPQNDELMFIRELVQARAHLVARKRAQIRLDTAANAAIPTRQDHRSISVLNRPVALRIELDTQAYQFTAEHHRGAIDP